MCRVCGRTAETAGLCPDDGESFRPAQADTLIGTLIDQRFQIKELLGVGGWSRVYRAHHKRLGTPIVLKVMHTHLVQDTEKLKRFQREADISSRMRHTNIAKVMEFGLMPEGQPFLVMEYLEGETLNMILDRQGPFAWQQVVLIINQAAEAFAYAHDQGVIHRDIKPSNLLLTTDGTIKVLDFGLAKASLQAPGRGSSLTKAGQTMGTPDYMSPEQCQGMILGPPSDIYSLGLVAYELLTGTKVVSGSTTFEIMRQHVDKPPPPFKPALRIPSSVQDAVFKALYKQPLKRYESMRAMRAAFDVSTLPVPAATSVSMPKHLILPLIGSLVLGMVVCALAGWLIISRQSSPAPQVVAPGAAEPSTSPLKSQLSPGEQIALLKEKESRLGHFDYTIEKQLMELYLPHDRQKALETVDSILKNKPGDDAMTAILAQGHFGAEPDRAAEALGKTARDFADLKHVRAQCLLLLGDLYAERGDTKKALQYYDNVLNFSGPSLEPYRLSAEDRVNVLKKLKLN
jgi:serine/threonine protein kinase